MKCNICGKKFSSGSLVYGFGFVCPACQPKAIEERKAHHAELLAEDVQTMPESLTTADFERWALKLAVHYVDRLTKEQREELRLAAIPEELANHFKELILRHVHRAYVSSADARGHERLFYGGTYMFRQPVPKEHIVKAAMKAEILEAKS